MERSNRSSNELPARLWMFDRLALRDGDVLLEVGNSKVSPLIAKFDGGPFTHALIWVGNTDFVEAVGTGVRNIAYMRVLLEEPHSWLLLRHPDAELACRAAVAARGFIAKRYDRAGALSSKSDMARPNDPEALFCSQLVAEAYLQAGLELVPGVETNKVTPRSLLDCKFFRQLSPTLVELDPSEYSDARKFVDRDAAYEDSIPEKGARIEREVFDGARDLLADLIDPQIPEVRFPPGNLSELIGLLRCIPSSVAEPLEERLLRSMQETGYFKQLDEPMRQTMSSIASRVLQLRDHALTDRQRNSIRASLQSERYSWGLSAEHHNRNAKVCRDVLRWHSHALWESLASMYSSNASKFVALMRLTDDVLPK